MWPRSILASRLRWLLATAGRARSLLLVAFGLSFIPHQPRPTILLPSTKSTYRLYGRRLLEEMTSLEVVQQWWEFWVNNFRGRVYIMVVSKNKEFLFFCFLKSFVFLQKMETKNKKQNKVKIHLKNLSKSAIWIDFMQIFCLELISTWSVVCNLAKKFDARAFLN